VVTVGRRDVSSAHFRLHTVLAYQAFDLLAV
jgi:hypothetical protein